MGKKISLEERAEQVEFFKMAKGMLALELEFATKAVAVYTTLIRRCDTHIDTMANPDFLHNKSVRDKTIPALLEVLHFRYGGDRERFFSESEYRYERMKCIGSNALIYDKLISLLGDF